MCKLGNGISPQLATLNRGIMPKEHSKADLIRVGRIIQDSIDALGYPSMAEAARKIGIERIVLHNWVNGKTKGFDAETFIQLCLSLKLHPTWVLWGEEEYFTPATQVDRSRLEKLVKNTLDHLHAQGTPVEAEVVARVVTKLYQAENAELSQQHGAVIAQLDLPNHP